MSALTPEENALVAYALLDEVNSMMANGARVEDVTRDIARAQVYATLAAAVRPVPLQATVKEAISRAVKRELDDLNPGALQAAANAVMGLL